MSQKRNLAIYSIIYAAFYSLCLYKNLTGVTFPFFAVGSLVFLGFCMKEFGKNFKKDSIPEIIAIVGISSAQVLTANLFLNIFNVLFVFALLFHVAIHQFNLDKNWNFFQHTIYYIASLFMGLINCFAPFIDVYKYKREKEILQEEGEAKQNFPWYIIVITVICCFPVLCVVLACLASADAVFSNMLGNLFDIKLGWFKVVILTVVVFLFAYGIISNLNGRNFKEEELHVKAGNPLIAITAGVMFDVVYVFFCIIQIFYLFIGKFSLPEGYSYATYAREGFFQLLFVCILNIAMVLCSIMFVNENKAVKIILSILCGCTYIMTASSAYRMILYIKYYYFSFLRILVLWTLFVIALLLTGLLLQIWKKNFDLFKYSVVVISICYMALSFFNPDYKIAKWNLANSGNSKSDFFITDETYRDYNYLVWNLSEDAAPILMQNENTKDAYAERWTTENEERKLDFRTYNVSKYNSDKLIGK